jgi:endoglucanase
MRPLQQVLNGLCLSLQLKTVPLSALGFLLLLAPSAWAQNALVRVNQLGYATGAPKRAYLISKSSEAGATFVLDNSAGTAVFGPAAIGASAGTWGSFTVYPLDFDAVNSAGSYTISVTGPVNATSPSFPIDTGTNVYSGAIANALSYFQNSRDGSNFIPSPLRTAAGHLNDASAKVYHDNLTATGATINADGGWWDAGDYLKFVETHSYTVAMLLVGVRDFPNQMRAGSSTSNFTAETKFGLDWLKKMWDDSSQTLYYQVGVGQGVPVSDHDLWRLPQADDNDSADPWVQHRPVFVNPNGERGAKISPNLAGRLAADFALCYQVFKVANPSYANQCLLSAEDVFTLADTSPGQLTTTNPFNFYGETVWQDDMELGATELYYALAAGNLPPGLPQTDPLFYLRQAANWANAYIIGPNDASDTLNLYDVSGLAHYELHRAITQAGNPGGLAVTQAQLVADLQKELNNATTQAGKDPFGFGIVWNNDDTTSKGAGVSVMASEYTFLTGQNTYAKFSTRWLDNILGANAWGSSFIVGDGTSFPYCIQHQVANLMGHLDGTAPVLKGAVVEGPNAKGTSGNLSGMKACNDTATRYTPFNGNGSVFVDWVESFNTAEPTIDLTASSPLAFAWQTGNPGATPDFSLSATPASQSVTAGASTTYTATVAALNGFAGNVSLSATGLPSGASASFNPASVAGSGSSSLTVTTSSSTPIGTFTVTITGTSGSLSHTAQISLTVNPVPIPDFSISASPSSQTVTAGNSTSFTANVSPTNGFNGSVAMSVTGLPAGAIGSFNPASISNGSGSSTLTISTATTTAAGSYPLTITGTSGSLSHAVNATLVVNTPDFTLSASPSSRTITVGNSTTYTASVSPLNGFNGAVALSVSGLPANATGSFNPNSVSGGSGTSTLTVSTTSSTLSGTFTVTITGTSGNLNHSAIVTLVLNPSTGLPAGWTDLDIGAPPIAGSATFNGGTFTVNGNGKDIWSTSDQFNYAYLPVTGDLTVTTRVATQQNTNVWAKAGAMIRETTGANSSYVFVMVTPGKGLSMQYRPSTGASAVNLATTAGPVAPYWVRLQRAGNSFTGSTSTDGSTWTQLGNISVTMAGSVTAGLANTSHNTAALNTSTFDNVTVGTPGPNFTLTATPSSQTVSAGASTTFTATVGPQNGFSGIVMLSVSGLPSGATGTFNPTSVSGGSGASTLNVSTSGATPTGSYPLTITGTSGSLTQTTSVTLVVNPVGGTPVYQINSGGPAVAPFAADAFFSGGQTASTTAAINTSGTSNPAPMAVYQTERWGGDSLSNPAPFSYTFTSLTPGASYTVRLHFAEIFWAAAGQRKFNVAINGVQVLTNFDILATAGAANKAIVQQFRTTANASGNIVISYTVGTADAPKSSGIEILR